MNKPLAAGALLPVFLAAVLLGGCHDSSPVNTPEPPSTTVAPAPSAATVLPAPGKPGKGVIYVVSSAATGTDDLTPETVTLRDAQTPARDALLALIQSPHSPLPSGIALRGITLQDGLATVDFSQSPVDETHGEGDQTRALTALSRTLGQFPNILQMQIMVRGKLTTNFGEFSSDGPMDVIRPEASQASAGTPSQ